MRQISGQNGPCPFYSRCILLELELEHIKDFFVLHEVDGAQVGDKTLHRERKGERGKWKGERYIDTSHLL
jgi:hypothetical protein